MRKLHSFLDMKDSNAYVTFPHRILGADTLTRALLNQPLFQLRQSFEAMGDFILERYYISVSLFMDDSQRTYLFFFVHFRIGLSFVLEYGVPTCIPIGSESASHFKESHVTRN